MTAYSDAFRKHFLEPRNVGSLPAPAAVARGENAACGDVLQLFLSVGERGIERATFEARACSAVIATASLVTEALAGRTLEEARALVTADLVAELGELPRHKAHAPKLVQRVLDDALRALPR